MPAIAYDKSEKLIKTVRLIIIIMIPLCIAATFIAARMAWFVPTYTDSIQMSSWPDDSMQYYNSMQYNIAILFIDAAAAVLCVLLISCTSQSRKTILSIFYIIMAVGNAIFTIADANFIFHNGLYFTFYGFLYGISAAVYSILFIFIALSLFLKTKEKRISIRMLNLQYIFMLIAFAAYTYVLQKIKSDFYLYSSFGPFETIGTIFGVVLFILVIFIPYKAQSDYCFYSKVIVENFRK